MSREKAQEAQTLRLLRFLCLFAAVHLSPIPRTWQCPGQASEALSDPVYPPNGLGQESRAW